LAGGLEILRDGALKSGLVLRHKLRHAITTHSCA
jgi:hypothetical protein